MSIEETLKKQISDLETISLAADLLPLLNRSSDDKCLKDLKDQIKRVQNLQDAVTMAETEKKELMDREKKLLTEMKMVDEWIERVKNNTPETCMKAEGKNGADAAAASMSGATPRNIRDLRPKCFAPNISFISEEEFRCIPNYMLGRLTLTALNEFISKINAALNEKYELLNRPQNTIKNPNDLMLYRQHKKAEKENIEGKPFVGENLVAKQLGLQKFDKQSLNKITVLRHAKRIVTKTNAGALVLFFIE